LQKGIDLVSLARPLLADAQFVKKAMEDRADEINVCIGCNQSWYTTYALVRNKPTLTFFARLLQSGSCVSKEESVVSRQSARMS
jgi:hypothetical protein